MIPSSSFPQLPVTVLAAFGMATLRDQMLVEDNQRAFKPSSSPSSTARSSLSTPCSSTCLLLIYSFLPISDLSEAMRTCKRWRLDDSTIALLRRVLVMRKSLPPSFDEVIANSRTTAEILSQGRRAKSKAAKDVVVSQMWIQNMIVGERSYSLHSSSNPGIVSLASHPTTSNLVLTGGNDGQAMLVNKTTGRIASQLQGHKGAVVDVNFHPTQSILFTASVDSTAHIWKNDGAGKYTDIARLEGATDALTSLDVHPSGNYLATSSKDGCWVLWDVNSGTEIRRMPGSELPVSTIDFHPDGALVVAGCQEGGFKCYDLRSWKLAATCTAPGIGPTSSFASSPNGFHCASGDENGAVKQWDLRTLRDRWTILTATQPVDCLPIRSLAFDSSSTYLAASVRFDVEVLSNLDGTSIVTLDGGHQHQVTGLAWSEQAKSIVSVGLDGRLNLWESKLSVESTVAPHLP